ncbi:MAG: gamma-glutamyltransferase [Phycisphaeraceae bacterium]|nr:gamma-glutamyltransferase [Phycisphaeraceae bacterium]
MVKAHLGSRIGVAGLSLLILVPALATTGCSASRYAQTFPHAAVAADHEVASRAGAEILARGGNAVDAAVATSFALSVVRPYSCGIGGGGFMVVYFPDHPRLGRVSEAINYRETCPRDIGPDFYERTGDDSASTHGGRAVAVPGSVAGLLLALERYGTLDRATVLAPAIRAAETGFVVDAHYEAAAIDIAEQFESHPEWKERFAFVWTHYLQEGRIRRGSRITNPGQADALRLIAEYGAAAFYEGPIADAICDAVRSDGGVLSRADLAEYSVRVVKPLEFGFLGGTVLTMPPPSSGGIALAQILGIFEALGATEMGSATLAYDHALVEAMKHAFADRARWLGDPEFVEVPTARLISGAYIADRAVAFDPERTLPVERYGTIPPVTADGAVEDHGTSHFCVVDGAGNAVACTETINLEFGSLLAVDRFGFCLNNEMDDFLTRAGEPNAFGLTQSVRNRPEPGKRPLSSMTPTIMLDAGGAVSLVVGASGGPRIISGTAQVLLNVAVLGNDAGEAVERRRIHHQWMPDVVVVEEEDWTPGGSRGSEGDEALDLTEFGHRVKGGGAIGNVQVICRSGLPVATQPGGEWRAACDPRKGGIPAGN